MVVRAFLPTACQKVSKRARRMFPQEDLLNYGPCADVLVGLRVVTSVSSSMVLPLLIPTAKLSVGRLSLECIERLPRHWRFPFGFGFFYFQDACRMIYCHVTYWIYFFFMEKGREILGHYEESAAAIAGFFLFFFWHIARYGMLDLGANNTRWVT